MSKFIVNAFQVPNAVIDDYLADLSGNAFKCYMFIARKTVGWGKSTDKISVSQFMDNSGIKNKKTVYSALDELEKIGLIVIEKTKGQINCFRLNFKLDQYQKKVVPKNGTSTNYRYRVVPKNGTGTSTKNWYSTKDNIKNTITNNILFSLSWLKARKKKKFTVDKKTAEQIADLYNEILYPLGLPKCTLVSDKRHTAIKTCWMLMAEYKKQQLKDTDQKFDHTDKQLMLITFERFFHHITKSDYLMGHVNDWKADFDFIFTKSKFLRILEKFYHSKQKVAA